MKYDALHYPYPSQRNMVFGTRGMVGTSHPLAAQAGLDMLKKGGNAIDAAIATAACLTVVEPTSNGIGGDAFALVWVKDRLYGLNSSGPAPEAISLEKLQASGVTEMPRHGWIPVTVPGVPAAWAALSQRFGRLPFATLLEPAITYANEGHPLSPTTAKYWNKAFQIYADRLQGDQFRPWFQTFAPKGRAPHAGEIWASPGHGKTLERIGASLSRDFYEGELAEKIHQFSVQGGGFLTQKDLAAYQPQWVDPISVPYRGYRVWELPPNGQGLVALMALNILRGFEFEERESLRTYHLQLEAIKLAFADGQQYITDPRHMALSVEDLLSEAYGAERRKLITEKAQLPAAGRPAQSGTVYLATADGEGNMVSFIQSNYMGFGSGLVVPGTGIALQNRGHNFSLDPGHPNRLEPGKRTYHTIIPGFLTKGEQPVGPFGVMGGFMQPQGHVQVVTNTIDFQMNPQAALDAPRWCWEQEKSIQVEPQVPEAIREGLLAAGHKLTVASDHGLFGRGQIIWRTEEGALAGGTEGRTDGTLAVW